MRRKLSTNSTIDWLIHFYSLRHYLTSVHPTQWMQLKRCPARRAGKMTGLCCRHACSAIHASCVFVCMYSGVYICCKHRHSKERENPFPSLCFFFATFGLTMSWYTYLHATMYHIHSLSPSIVSLPLVTPWHSKCLPIAPWIHNENIKKRRNTSFPQAFARLTLQHYFTS